MPVGLEQLCINTLRTLAIDGVQAANSGHPGLPMGAAPMAHVLWNRHLNHDPTAPTWPDRDRFVLSAGHGSMLLYGLMHVHGYDLSLDDLKAFRQLGSRTPGHPESFATPGVETTTGPLGQGAANSVGMAVAERFLAHQFNRDRVNLVDHRTYALVSDGDLMEGVCAEASALAGQMQLGKLIWLWDDNGITIDGGTEISMGREDVRARYRAYGWQVLEVADGDHDIDAIDEALTQARAETRRPSLICVRTTIGYGSPNKRGKSSSHGSPLGEDEVTLTKEALGWDPTHVFHVPEEARARFLAGAERGQSKHAEWEARLEKYRHDFPEQAALWDHSVSGDLPRGWDALLPSFEAGEELATRQASGKALNAIAARVPWLLGGAADLAGSVQTDVKGEALFDGETGAGRNIAFGIREHAMAALANGMAYHGGMIPYTGTFFVFSDYMRPAVRLAAMGNLQVIHIWSHDSIGLGEDGPTHQPVEHLASLRAMPGLRLLRPADANETVMAWRIAMESRDHPVGLVLSRQKLPTLDRSSMGSENLVRRGAYVLSDPPNSSPRGILIGTGSEVHLALAAQHLLAAEGVPVRVVSMPSWDLFAEQSAAYRESVLPHHLVARVAVEAGVAFGWARWIGEAGRSVTMESYGASGPASDNFAEFGFTAEHVAEVMREVLAEIA